MSKDVTKVAVSGGPCQMLMSSGLHVAVVCGSGAPNCITIHAPPGHDHDGCTKWRKNIRLKYLHGAPVVILAMTQVHNKRYIDVETGDNQDSDVDDTYKKQDKHYIEDICKSL